MFHVKYNSIRFSRYKDIKGVLGRYINLMRPFHHYALRTSHYAFSSA